jgi:hypothetical protein
VKIARTIRTRPPLRARWPSVRRRSESSGFAYLLALFMVLAIVIGSEVVIQNAITLGRRERESELIWRGNQYIRAIRLYYHKTGHYPQSLDDLKTGLPDLHFLRAAAYKDPMNTEDGAWRFIYINGTGQIVGSVRYATLQQMAFMDLAGCPAVIYDGDSDSSDESASTSSSATLSASASSGGTGAGASANGATTGANAQPNPCAQPNLNASTSQPGAAPGQNPLSGMAAAMGVGAVNSTQSSVSSSSITSTSSSGQGFSPGQPPNPFAGMKPTGPVDEPVVGGFLTGIASKVDKTSIKVYKGGKKYKDWEFIWNPIEDQARAVQQGIGAAQQGGQVGQSILNGLGAGLSGALNNGAAATGINGAAATSGNGAAPAPQSQDQQQPSQPAQQPPQ